jgi:hypothetical protein
VPVEYRSPFLEFEVIVPQKNVDMMIDCAPDDKRPFMEATLKASVDFAAKVFKFLNFNFLISIFMSLHRNAADSSGTG